MEKKDILEQLAHKKITREQAEAMFAEQASPIPDEPPPAPAKTSKRSTGCLIGIIVAALLVPLIIFAVFILFLTCSAHRSTSHEFIELPTRHVIESQNHARGNSGPIKHLEETHNSTGETE